MDLFSFLIYFLLAVLIFGYFYIKRVQGYWKRLNVPYVEPEFFYGNSKGIDKEYPNGFFFRDLYLKYKSKGPILGCYVYLEPIAIVADLDLVKTVLVKDFNTFPSRGSYHNEQDDPSSANLFNISGDQWKSLRSKLTPTFSSGKIKMMFSTVSEVSDKFMERISIESKATGQLEIKDILARFTTDVIGQVAFGINCDSLEDSQNDFYIMGLRAFRDTNFLKRRLIQKYPDLARKLHITSTEKEVANFYRDIIDQTINYRQENNIQRNDFINLLMSTWKTENPLTFNQIWAQSFIFFLAGFETSSTALTFALYELSQHLDIQQKARESVKNVLEKFDGELSYDSVSELQYIEQCAKEAMRRYPPLAHTRRVASKNFNVPNTDITIEKGTPVIIPIWGFHFDEDIYPNPTKYDPDRFSPEESAKRPNFTFLPFGDGPKNCIGERFAMVEIKLALAKILLNYEFSLDRKKTPVPLKFANSKLILAPESGIYINFKKI